MFYVKIVAGIALSRTSDYMKTIDVKNHWSL